MAPRQNQENESWERFEALYRSSRDDVYAYVLTLLRDRAAAEDVTAIAFERAYRRRRTFDRHRGDERGWLFGIARNAALDELRRRRRLAALVVDPEDVGADEAAGADEEDTVLRRAMVREALESLSARDAGIELAPELLARPLAHGGDQQRDIRVVVGTERCVLKLTH
jgi:RNA polymerase sigma factor (sigma-70 family)